MLQFHRRSDAPNRPIGQLPPWLCALLCARGITTEAAAERFLHPDLSQLYDPFAMQGMDQAVAILRGAAEHGQRVQIYGDYDCDGVTATAIMLETLRDMGVAADYRIPDRHREGYGLNEDAVREIARDHQILLTVDCGITNHAEVLLAQRLGMTVIVTDHHQLAETPSPADVVLNPLCGDYPFRRLCGAGVALKLTQALLGMEAVEKRIELAAIATIADIVPLIDENRVIVSEGLRRLRHTPRLGLQSLMAQAGLASEAGSAGDRLCFPQISAGQVAFRVAPRINAGGRLEHAAQCVELLTCADGAQGSALAEHLEHNNQTRQAMQEEITRLAEAEILEKADFYADRVLIVMGEGWNSGVIGLAAGKLCEKYHYPTIVLSRSGDVAVGSCRSIPGVNIHAMLTQCADLFMRFGGHEQAAGLTMQADLVPELRRRLNLYITGQCDPACYIPAAEYDDTLPLRDVTLEMIDQLALMQPTGYGNPAPVFLTCGAEAQRMQPVGREGTHLRLSLLEGEALRSGIAFGMGHLASLGCSRLDVLYAPEKNEFRGQVTPQLQVKALRPAAGEAPLPDADTLFEGILQECAALMENDCNQGEIAPAALTSAAWKRLCADGLGVLMIAHTRAAAEQAAAQMPLDTAVGRTEEPRPFNTVLLNPRPEGLRDSWHHIVLLEGEALPGEAAMLHTRCPRAQLHTLKADTALRQQLAALALTIPQLQGLYIALRDTEGSGPRSRAELAARAGLNAAQTQAGLMIFDEIGYCVFTANPWSVRMTPRTAHTRKPQESRLYSYLQQLRPEKV